MIETDPHILDQLDLTGFQPNGMAMEKNAKMDAVNFQMLHKNNLTGMLIYSFKEDEDDDIAMFPVQGFYSFYSAFRPGVGSIFGLNEESAFEVL